MILVHIYCKDYLIDTRVQNIINFSFVRCIYSHFIYTVGAKLPKKNRWCIVL